MRLARDKRPGGVGGFGMNRCPFWYDGGGVGGVFGLLPWIGGVFNGGLGDPPSPPMGQLRDGL